MSKMFQGREFERNLFDYSQLFKDVIKNCV